MPRNTIAIAWFFILFSIFSEDVYSQTRLDSLLVRVNTSHGVEQVDVYNQLSYEYSFFSIDEAKKYAKLAYEIADSLRYKPGKAKALHQWGLISYLEGDFRKAEERINEALEIARKITDLRTIRDCYKTLAIIYEESNALDKSLENYEKAHEVIMALGNDLDIAQSNLNLGITCRKQFNRERAQQYIGDALTIYRSLDNIQGMANSLAEAGKLFMDLNNFDTVRVLLMISDSLTRFTGNDYLSLKVYNYYATFFRKIQIPDSAIYFDIKALEIARKLNDVMERQKILLNLSEDYAVMGDYKQAQIVHQQYGLLTDSLFGKDDTQALVDTIDGIFVRTRVENQDQFDKFDFWNENYIWILPSSGGLLLFFIILLLYRRYHEKSSDIRLIEEQKGQLLELSNQLEKKSEAIKKLNERDERLKKQNQTLRELFSQDENEPERIDSRIQDLTRIMTDNLDADRAGIWQLTNKEQLLEAIDQYNRIKDQHTSGETIETKRYPLYFEALRNAPSIGVFNVAEDSRTAEFNQDRNPKLDIKSRLDVPILISGKLIGILWTEYIKDYRQPQEEDEGFLMSISTMVGELLIKRNRSRQMEQVSSEVKISPIESHYNSLKGILASLNCAVLAFDAKLNIVLFNPKSEELFLRSSKDVLKKNISILLGNGRDNPSYSELLMYVTNDSSQLSINSTMTFVDVKGDTIPAHARFSRVSIEGETYLSCILIDKIPGNEMRELPDVFDFFLLDQDELVRVQLYDTIKSAIESINRVLTEGVTIHYNAKKLPLIDIYNDKLIEVLKMIIKNALRSITGPGDIYIRTEVGEENVKISIADTGEGLSKEKQKQSFDPFILDADRIQLRGMGLVKWIVELNGGRIKINSRLGKGSDVTITLPLKNHT